MKAMVIHWGVARKGLLGEVWVEEQEVPAY